LAKKEEVFSILDRGLVFEGTLSCKGKVLIKGTVKGTLEGEFITIGEEGAVYAETTAHSMTIGGKFEGKVEAAEKLIVLATGSCDGTVVCKDLVVESGGILNAQVTRLAPSPAVASPPHPGLFNRKKKPGK
jgi:cytoskeletal protein CcmA (bactofilin family)